MNHREARVHQHLSQQLHAPLVLPPERPALLALQGPDGFFRPRQQHRWQRGGEDEACGVGAHRVHQGAGAGNVATDAAECLAWKTRPIKKLGRLLLYTD